MMDLLNPNLAFGIVRRNGEPTRIHIAAPKKNRFLILSTVKDSLKDVEAVLTHKGGKPSSELLPRLREMQIYVEPDVISAFPAYRAEVDIENDGLSPAFLNEIFQESSTIEFNDGEIPKELRQSMPKAFHRLTFCSSCPNEEVIWVKNKRTSVWWPFHLTKEQAAVVRSRQERHKQDLPECPGEITLPVAHDEHRGQSRAKRSTHEPMLAVPGLIEGAIPLHQRRAMSEYFRSLRLSGAMRLGDRDSKNRCWLHNEKVARFFGLQFGEFISTLVGVRLVPLFSHFVSYLEEASLPTHFDKDPRAVSLSIQLGFYDRGKLVENSWPFHVKSRGNDDFTEFLPQCGDAVIFHGESQEHYRTKIAAGCVSDVLLIHFIMES